MVRCNYDVMGLDLNATPQEVKNAYKKLALKLHPDKNRGNEARAEVAFTELSAAYEVLSDPNARAHYNAIYKNMFAEIYQGRAPSSSTSQRHQHPQRNPSARTRSRAEEEKDYEGYFFFQEEDLAEAHLERQCLYFEIDGNFHEEFMAYCSGKKFGFVHPSTSVPYDVHAKNCKLCEVGSFCIHRVHAEYPHKFVPPPRPINSWIGEDEGLTVEFTLEEFFHGKTKHVRVYAGDVEATGGTQSWYKLIPIEIEPGTQQNDPKKFRNTMKTTNGITYNVFIGFVLKKHDKFRWVGNNLVYDMPRLGWIFDEDSYSTIEGIDGENLSVKNPSPSHRFRRCVIKGAGMPNSVGSSERGDLNVWFSEN